MLACSQVYETSTQYAGVVEREALRYLITPIRLSAWLCACQRYWGRRVDSRGPDCFRGGERFGREGGGHGTWRNRQATSHCGRFHVED